MQSEMTCSGNTLVIAHPIYGSAASHVDENSIQIVICDSRGARVVDGPVTGIRRGARPHCQEIYYDWCLDGPQEVPPGLYRYRLTFRTGGRERTSRGEVFVGPRETGHVLRLSPPLMAASLLLSVAALIGSEIVDRTNRDSREKEAKAAGSATADHSVVTEPQASDGTVRAGRKGLWIMQNGRWESLTVVVPDEGSTGPQDQTGRGE